MQAGQANPWRVVEPRHGFRWDEAACCRTPLNNFSFTHISPPVCGIAPPLGGRVCNQLTMGAWCPVNFGVGGGAGDPLVINVQASTALGVGGGAGDPLAWSVALPFALPLVVVLTEPITESTITRVRATTST